MLIFSLLTETALSFLKGIDKKRIQNLAYKNIIKHTVGPMSFTMPQHHLVQFKKKKKTN